MGEKHFISAGFLLSVVSCFKKDRRSLPAVLESALSWLAAVLLAVYLGYGYAMSTTRSYSTIIWPFNKQDDSRHVPLTTTTWGKNETIVLADTLQELDTLLETISRKKDVVWNKQHSNIDNDGLVSLMRSSVEARRLASTAMKIQLQKARTGETKNDAISNDHALLWKQLEQLWPRLLKLPSFLDEDNDDQEYPFRISLVVPAYGEKGTNVQSNLQRALSSSQNPSHIQLVIVDAGKNEGMKQATVFEKGDNNNNSNKKTWGDIQLISFSAGGGRGPTLNFGAKHATGKIITFLHSDNILPDEWDEQIISTFGGSDQGRRESQPSSSDLKTNIIPKKQPIACAFSFRINDSLKALNGGVYPPGLAAAQWSGAVRTQRFHVLYGDSVLSMPAAYFRYIGGYPDQALMEDYDVMDLLRKRVSVLNNETLCILPSETLISPRRWQVNGVPYVMLFNCLCVFLYEHRGWSPEELYKFYYQRRSSSS